MAVSDRFAELQRVEDPEERWDLYERAVRMSLQEAPLGFVSLMILVLLGVCGLGLYVPLLLLADRLGLHGWSRVLLVAIVCPGTMGVLIFAWMRWLHVVVFDGLVRKAIWRELHWAGHSICAECGYDLCGAEGGRCPECGSEATGPHAQDRAVGITGLRREELWSEVRLAKAFYSLRLLGMGGLVERSAKRLFVEFHSLPPGEDLLRVYTKAIRRSLRRRLPALVCGLGAGASAAFCTWVVYLVTCEELAGALSRIAPLILIAAVAFAGAGVLGFVYCVYPRFFKAWMQECVRRELTACGARLCVECGYSLAGAKDGRCPLCRVSVLNSQSERPA